MEIPIGEIKEIPLSQISPDQEGCLYPMSFAFDLEPLRASIKVAGIVNPPILRVSDEGGSPQIVTGLRRIMAARELELEAIQCRVLQSDEISRKDALLLALHENLACRRFNPVEKALVLKHLSEHFSIKEICDKFLRVLGLARRPEIYRLYLEIEEKLPLIAKKALASGKLHPKTAGFLLDISAENVVMLVSCGIDLNFNINQFNEFIDIMIDLSYKYNEPVGAILQRPEISDIINSTTNNIPQKANALLKALRALRYPKVTETETRLRKKIEALRLPPDVRFILPPFLEDSEYRLEIRFKDEKGLRKALQGLWEASGTLSLEPPLLEALRSMPKRYKR